MKSTECGKVYIYIFIYYIRKVELTGNNIRTIQNMIYSKISRKKCRP